MERQANGNRSSLKPVGGHGLLQLGPALGRYTKAKQRDGDGGGVLA